MNVQLFSEQEFMKDAPNGSIRNTDFSKNISNETCDCMFHLCDTGKQRN